MGSKVSIITPVYNGARTISRTIQSVLAQTHQNWEHIIIDDGSIDETSQTVHKYFDSRLRYFHQSNAGRSAARNRAIDVAEGNCFLFLDADDWLLPQALETHLSFLAANPQYDVSVSDGHFCTDQGEDIVSLSERRGPVASGAILPRLVIDSGTIGAPHCVLLKRDVVDKYNVRFDTGLTIGEDWLLWIEIAQHVQFGFTPKVTCKYRWHTANTTLSASNAFRNEQLWLVRQRIMNAGYFWTLPASTKETFFFQVVVQLLDHDPNRQEEAMRMRQFVNLPRRLQGKFWRLAANQYILRNERLDIVRRWLVKALKLSPLDVKTLVVVALTIIHPAVARWVLSRWSKVHIGSQEPVLPPHSG